jgi:acetylglutamate kinase
MKYVVKLGGAGLETPSLLEGCTRAIAELVRDGHQVAVVHGGGVQLTRMLKALGKQSEFINGLRVTDAETRDVALMVFAGKVNKRLGGRAGRAGSAGRGPLRRRRPALPRAQEAHRARPWLTWARLPPAIRAGLKPSGS